MSTVLRVATCCRFVDPTVDLVAVEWSPFRAASYMLPLLNDLEGWRAKLKDISQQAQADAGVDWFIHNPDTTFVADFPGSFISTTFGSWIKSIVTSVCMNCCI